MWTTHINKTYLASNMLNCRKKGTRMIKTIPKYIRFARILDIFDFHVLLPFITESHLDFRGCLSMNLLQAKTTD